VRSLAARPVPADAPPLRRVRSAQLREQSALVTRVYEGVHSLRDFPKRPLLLQLPRQTRELFRLAIESEGTPAGKVALAEDQVKVFALIERLVDVGVQTGNHPPYDGELVRFHRLEAEADLLALKQALADKK
jgi:hypothetical protein